LAEALEWRTAFAPGCGMFPGHLALQQAPRGRVQLERCASLVAALLRRGVQ
jgi:hypothetical protein